MSTVRSWSSHRRAIQAIVTHSRHDGRTTKRRANVGPEWVRRARHSSAPSRRPDQDPRMRHAVIARGGRRSQLTVDATTPGEAHAPRLRHQLRITSASQSPSSEHQFLRQFVVLNPLRGLAALPSLGPLDESPPQLLGVNIRNLTVEPNHQRDGQKDGR